MANKLPWIFSGSKVCIICEGDEEYEYLDKLISLDVWNENYKFTLENAEGNGNIPARYQDKYQNGSYDVVLVFCDTDRKPYGWRGRGIENKKMLHIYTSFHHHAGGWIQSGCSEG